MTYTSSDHFPQGLLRTRRPFLHSPSHLMSRFLIAFLQINHDFHHHFDHLCLHRLGELPRTFSILLGPAGLLHIGSVGYALESRACSPHLVRTVDILPYP